MNEKQRAASALASMTTETCENCGKPIGKLEAAHLYQEHVVCAGCLDALTNMQQIPPAMLTERPLRHQPVATYQQLNVNTPLPKKIGALAIVAIVFAAIALGVSWIPFLGLVALPFAGIAILLGLIGVVVAMSASDVRVAPAVAGIFLACVAIAVQVVFTGSAATVISNSITAAKQRDQQSNQTVIANPLEGKPVAEENGWALATNPIKQGDIVVTIKGVKVGRVPLKVMGEARKSDEPQAMIELELFNASEKKKYDYKPWNAQGISLGREFAQLTDDSGNSYKRISFGYSAAVIGAASGSASLYPKSRTSDVLVFEAPVSGATSLLLELPASSFGGTGKMRIRIPAGMISAAP